MHFIPYLLLSMSLILTSAFGINLNLSKKDNIVQAINDISKKEKKIIIHLKKSTYKLDGNNNEYLFDLKNLDRFVLDGHGSTLIITNPSSGLFRFVNSQNITVKNLTIDYAVLPNVAGRIKNMNKEKDSLVFSSDLNYEKNLPVNLKIEKNVKARVHVYFFRKPGVPKKESSPVAYVKDIKKVGTDQYLIKFTKKCKFEKNDHVILLFRYNSQSIFRMISCQHVSYSNINMFASPGGIFVARNTSNVHITNCNVLLKKGRWISSNADMFHFQSSRKGPIIQNCTVEGIGDDILNFYTKPMYPIKKISTHSLLMKKKNFVAKARDTLDFFDPKNGKILTSKIVEKIQSSGKHNLVYFISRLPRDMKVNVLRIYDKNCTSSGFKIENSIFRKSKRFGCYLKASNGIIANNHFSCLGNSSIMIRNEPTWPEGLTSENIIILNNHFDRCSNNMDAMKPYISIGFFTNYKHKKSKFNAQKNISIIKNTFSGKPYFDISNTENLIFYKNKKN